MMGEGEEGMEGRKDERSEGGKGEGGKGEERKDLLGTGHGITLGATKRESQTGIIKFNITIADIHTGARFPADCTNRADVAAADPRLDPVSHPPADV